MPTWQTVVITTLALLSGVESAAADTGGSENSWRSSERVAFSDAQKSRRHVLVVFGADWCPPCREIEQIMNEEEVFGLLSRSFVPLHFDITGLSDQDEALQSKYQALMIPSVIFLNANGQELGRWDHRDMSSESFVAQVRDILITYPVELMDPRTHQGEL